MWNLCRLLVAEPNCFLQGHDGPAYDVKFYGDDEDALLLRFDFNSNLSLLYTHTLTQITRQTMREILFFC